MSNHFRFYIYWVENPGPDSVCKYRTSTGGWDKDFTKAMMWDNLDHAKKKADEFVHIKNKCPTTAAFIINIGQSIIAVNPYFSILTWG